jgi:D-serine deaminase-like pyridoxal phosphate-dependent protein
VVRRPDDRTATLLGGGYPASGAAGADRLPQPLEDGLTLDRQEGAGEVQTPVHGGAGLRVGDRVWMRHAKAGELCERFNQLHLVRGEELVDAVPTYRGEGKAFL